MRFQHLAAGVGFAVLACVISWPLASHLGTHLPGGDIGDNIQFFWNFWWMREALATGADFFRTPYLFAPFGSDITLHTHTALPAFVGATLLGSVDVLTAHNLWLLTSLALNGFCAYLLAWRVTRDVAASLVAGLIFGASPYISAHLNGHFNLTSAWTIPLFALSLQPLLGADGESPRHGVGPILLAGLTLGLTAYVDYYYVVYQVAFAVVAWAWTTHEWSMRVRGATPASRRWALMFAALALCDGLLLITIGVTGGFRLELGPLTVSARTAFNPLQGLWILLALAALCYWRPALHMQAMPGRFAIARSTALVLCLGAVLAVPVIWHGAGLILRGEYVTQQYFWRTAPRGIDLGTLLLGNPFHGLWGDAVRSIYTARGIDAVESVAWPGIAPVALLLMALLKVPADGRVKYWFAVGAVFFVWALGPHLMVFGANTGLILPQTALRYIPIASNARIPGRAMVVTYLAIAMLGAIALAHWRTRTSRRASMVVVAAVLILIDFFPVPFPLAEVDRPAIYARVADDLSDGSILELPVGTRDSFQNQGWLDHRVLAYQSFHGRPIVGGVVSRLSPVVIAGYEQDPLIGPLLRASSLHAGNEDVGLPGRGDAARLLAANGVRFVMLNRETASERLTRYVEDVLPVTLVAHDGPRSLYVVGP